MIGSEDGYRSLGLLSGFVQPEVVVLAFVPRLRLPLARALAPRDAAAALRHPVLDAEMPAPVEVGDRRVAQFGVVLQGDDRVASEAETGTVAHELAEHEDRRGHEEGER